MGYIKRIKLLKEWNMNKTTRKAVRCYLIKDSYVR